MDAMSLLNAMTAKMRWHEQRQEILAQNVANANTPNYRGQELKPFDFAKQLDALHLDPVVTDVTDQRGFVASASGADGTGNVAPQVNFEVTPEGTGISIEDEMMKVNANQMDYQAVTALYSKSLALIRTALGGA